MFPPSVNIQGVGVGVGAKQPGSQEKSERFLTGLWRTQALFPLVPLHQRTTSLLPKHDRPTLVYVGGVVVRHGVVAAVYPDVVDVAVGGG